MSHELIHKFIPEEIWDKIPAGHYRKVIVDGKITAEVACGDCGESAYLDHEISIDGIVTPSLVCPKECGWHVMGKLENWEL